MGNETFTRRRTLAATGTALATGLAGCNSYRPETEPSAPDTIRDDRHQAGDGSDIEPHHTVYFRHSDERDSEEDAAEERRFSYTDLVLTQFGGVPRVTSDVREAFGLTIHDDLSTVTLEFDVATAVDLTAILHVPAVSSHIDGPYSTDLHLTETVEPTIDPEHWDESTLDFESITVEFDLPETLPTQVAIEPHAYLLVTEYFEDVPGDEDVDMGLYLAHQPTMAVSYDDSGGPQTYVFNDFKGLGYDGNDDDPQFLWLNYPDSDERTLLFTIHTHGVRWGGAVNIPHDRWNDYKDAYDIYWQMVVRNASYDSRSEYANPSGRVYNVDHHPHVEELAQSIWDAHTKAGITNQHDRLMATVRFVQHIPYQNRYPANPYYAPIQTLWRAQGLCTDKTYLYNAILRCDPYNIRTAHIRTTIQGYGTHRVTGIDVRDLDHVNNSWKTVSPSQSDINEGAPDTEYVFLDNTHLFNLGEYYDSVFSDTHFWDTTDLHVRTDLRDYGM